MIQLILYAAITYILARACYITGYRIGRRSGIAIGRRLGFADGRMRTCQEQSWWRLAA
jgi:hypothetical protein